jgi:2-octaprenylphenol hydroxylase
MDFHSDICIIGNGAIGKTAALGFAQAGASVTLVDAQAEASSGPSSVSPSSASSPARPASQAALPFADAGAATDRAPADDDWDLRVYAVNPLAQALLSRLRVWDALDANRICAVDAMQVHGDAEQHAGQIGFDAYGARVGALAWIVEDRHLNRALDSALQFSANVRRVAGTAQSMQADDSCATVRLRDGSGITSELLVGADGAQSWVRAQADIDLDYRAYGQRAVVANFKTTLPHHGVASQWFTAADGIIALLPLAGNRVSLVWSAPDALADVLLADSAEALAARLQPFCGAALGQLQPLGSAPLRAFSLSMLRPRAITARRMALVGDAAHVIHPLAGQGMNLGFADVAALLAAVAGREAHRDRGDARVLSTYARERKEDILLMQLATDGLQRLFATDFEPLRIARNIGLNLVNSLPVVKRRLIAQAMGGKS